MQETLAGYAVSSTRGRVHPEDEHGYRTPFQRDRDRIVHSTAFRRLEYKTQVFVNHEGDHYRTRLTHTLEVAQIARTIARALGLNEDLAETIALAHDLGHTPFGHSGEDALDKILSGHGLGFEHNMHGLRVVDLLEARYAAFPGLNLTYEVREAFVRHKSAYDDPLEPPAEFPGSEQSHLEGQVVSLADSIAYDSHDLDDGLVSRLLREEDLQGLALWRRVDAMVDPGLSLKMRRHALVRRLIDVRVTDLIESTRKSISEAGARTLEDVRAAKSWLVRQSADLAPEIGELEAFLKNRLYRHHRVMRMANKARRFVEELFDEFLAHPEDLPAEHSERGEADGLPRVVADYIAGMTDRYAQDAWKQLFFPYERM